MSILRTLLVKCMMGTLLFSSLQADEEVKPEHIVPGVRAMAHAERVKIQEERAEQEAQNLSEEESNETFNPGLNAAAALQFKKPKAGIYHTSHPGAFYNPVLVTSMGEIVELQDGSIWTVSSGDGYKTLNWLTSDLVVISANSDWFSSYMFRMTNQNTGVSVKCNLTLGPIYNGLFTHWIVGLNYFTNQLILDDGSIWKVTGFDSSTFSQWMLNDTIIIGINDGFLSSSKPNILINVNTLTYARANCTW